MKKTYLIILYCFLAVMPPLNAVAQKCDCIELDGNQKKLYLNGNNFTLLDNALRCFKLSSIANEGDSLVRIWILEDDFPDTPTTSRVKMFEFGKHGNVPVAELNILEWGFEKDSSLPVRCIKKQRLSPNKGWLSFERNIRSLNLPVLYQKPFINKGEVIVDYGMLIVQFLFSHTTYSVDFTGLTYIDSSTSVLQADHAKRIAYLLMYIQKHFSINLSLDSKQRDFLKGINDKLDYNN